MTSPVEAHADILRLRDGSPVLVRPVRPDDKAELRDAFDRLSDESRYLRFSGAKKRLTDSELAYLTEVDHHDHEALAALDPRTGRGVGIARYVRSTEDPELAEFAVVVMDDWQRRGIGTLLLSRLADRAREEGIRRYSAVVLAENRRAISLMEGLGVTTRRDLDAGTVILDGELPSEGMGAPLQETLRAAASGLVRVEIGLVFGIGEVRAHLRARLGSRPPER